MTTPLELPVLFLHDQVAPPGMTLPIALDDEARAAVDAARAAGSEQLLLAPRIDDTYPTVGAIATIEQVGRMPNGGPAAVLRATDRARIGRGVAGPGAALWVEAEVIEPSEPTERTHELATDYKRLVVATLKQRNAWQVIDHVESTTDPHALADLAGWAPYLTPQQRNQLLAEPDVDRRLETLITWTGDHLAEQEVSDKIATDVREGMEKNQREFLLRQQLDAIRKELGENEPEGADDYRSRVEAADLPDTVREAALREVGKLERSSEQSPEGGWIRTWLDTVLELPWNEKTSDRTDITAAREVLDADHYGLDDVKDRIVEYLAVRARRAERGLEVIGGRGSGAVLALVGPPGVGKTSLGESVARALDRKFVRVALGGVRDEAEIRGHRRTYVGALPGRIVRAIKEAGSMNPVVLLDEIDKVGSDFRGDPAAALLEVLDPAQNHTFRDHYLELDLDLSDVVFIATANTLETVPSALLDRMELVALDGYTDNEKVAIAETHLLPRQLERAALTTEDVTIDESALREMAGDYTREAGMRQMERLIGKILRKVATNLATGTAEPPVQVTEDDLVGYLGRPRFTPESVERTAVPGVATGLAVTGMGGDVLFIEAARPAARADSSEDMAGEPHLILTGQLGDVMKESAQIALSYLRAHGSEHGIDTSALTGPIHLHVPAGATPKDGPSAGVTMVTAFASLATGHPVRSEVGMTGEVTLNGRVLPIGGVKQKLLAAQRAGLTTVFIPKRNEPDLDDVPDEVRDALDIRPVSDVADIIAAVLEDAATHSTHDAA
ncbi:endopeptidase La [Flexivirga caeni]|uniref:Lon protease n=1 Tax=Flexivirga caeni TaxID=2294115 RepID=A0A3M9M7X3_9MICO|nr:endopeptidase La [Flexivirga caeni]RNI21670.1 endopeptidase La [Flexivirga caeni]